jgi:hypothetical protein
VGTELSVIERPGVGCEHPVEFWARFSGSAHTQVDVFRADRPAAAGGVFAQFAVERYSHGHEKRLLE